MKFELINSKYFQHSTYTIIKDNRTVGVIGKEPYGVQPYDWTFSSRSSSPSFTLSELKQIYQFIQKLSKNDK